MIRILLAEDDEAMRIYLARALENAGYEVVAVDRGTDALPHLEREHFDLLLSPTSPTTAFRFGEKVDDPLSMYLNDIYTIPANLAGLPGMSIACGFAEDGGKQLPVGLHMVGNYFAEAKMLNIAHQYQRATDWHLCAPGGI